MQAFASLEIRCVVAFGDNFDPEIIFLDEPTSSLDLQNEKIILDILNELSKNICVIMVSHKKIDIQNTEVIKLENGSLISSN